MARGSSTYLSTSTSTTKTPDPTFKINHMSPRIHQWEGVSTSLSTITTTIKTHSSHESWNQSISGRSTLLFLIENACGRCRLHSSCGLTCAGRLGFIIEKLTSVFCSGCCDDAKDFQVISFLNDIAKCPVQWSRCYVLVVCIQHHQH